MDLKLWGKYSEFNIYFKGSHWVFPLVPFLLQIRLVYEYTTNKGVIMATDTFSLYLTFFQFL